MSIHPTAVVDGSAVIGENVSIGPYVVIGPDVKIGDECELKSHNVVKYTDLGAGCVLYPFASLGLAPQHTGYKGEKGRLNIGPHCIFRESVTIHRGSPFGSGVTEIGENGYFMTLSHVAHDSKIGHHVIFANSVHPAGHVKIGDYSFISAMCGIHQYVRIGTGCIVSGGSMVSNDVPPFCLAQGDRARIKGLNLVGMKRMGLKRLDIQRVKSAFKTFFFSHLSHQEALLQPSLLDSNTYVSIFRDFLSQTGRGIMRPSTRAAAQKGEEATV